MGTAAFFPETIAGEEAKILMENETRDKPAEFTKEELYQKLEKVKDGDQESWRRKESMRKVNVGTGGLVCGTCHTGLI